MLATMLLAAVVAAGHAPASLNGLTLEYQLTKSTGMFEGENGMHFVTRFNGNHYTDADENGNVGDEGTYSYRVMDAGVSVVTYHPAAGTWAGGVYSETLHWDSPTGGHTRGVPKAGPGEYLGTFSVRK